MFYKTIITYSYANQVNIPIPSEEDDKIFVYNCIFCNFQSGCIKIENKHSIDFLHSSCFFYSNFNSDYGGSVYFIGASSIVQHRFCAYNTTTSSSYGLFSYSLAASSNFNHHVECSLTHCNASSYDADVFNAQYGTGSLSSSNSSQNSCQYGPGYGFYESNPSATINYTTVANNTAEYRVACHYFTGVYFLTNSNIINNEISSGYSGSSIVYSDSQDNLTVDSCCFFGNKPGPGKLFYLDKSYNNEIGKFIVKDSHVDSFSANDQYEVETQNITEDVSSFFLTHLSTYKCGTEIPLPPLHVNTQQNVRLFAVFNRTPSQTPEVFFGPVFTR